MVTNSISDSDFFHVSPPITRDFSKKRKANWFWKLKQWKIDARRKQWICQCKRENVSEEELMKSLRRDTFSYLQAWRVDHEQGSYKGFTICDEDDDDDDEIDLDSTSSSASSPTSVLKNKESVSNNSVDDDCFCCSKTFTEEDEEVFDGAFDNWDRFSDALNDFDENEDSEGRKTTNVKKEEDPSQRKKSNSKQLFHQDKKAIRGNNNNDKKKKKSEKQQQDCDEGSECPICSEPMDATDLSFLPCPCGFRLCLFCHNKINENDGRCPACREKYDQTINNSGQVSFQQRGRGAVPLSPSFKGLDIA